MVAVVLVACATVFLLVIHCGCQTVSVMQEAREQKALLAQFAHLLNCEQGPDFVPQAVVRQLTETT